MCVLLCKLSMHHFVSKLCCLGNPRLSKHDLYNPTIIFLALSGQPWIDISWQYMFWWPLITGCACSQTRRRVPVERPSSFHPHNKIQLDVAAALANLNATALPLITGSTCCRSFSTAASACAAFSGDTCASSRIVRPLIVRTRPRPAYTASVTFIPKEHAYVLWPDYHRIRFSSMTRLNCTVARPRGLGMPGAICTLQKAERETIESVCAEYNLSFTGIANLSDLLLFGKCKAWKCRIQLGN